MLHTIVIVREGGAGVVRRIDEDALQLASELLLQRLEREQVVAKDEPMIEDVLVADAPPGVIATAQRLRRIFEQNPRLQPRPILLANPRQLQLLLISAHYGLPADP